VGNDKGTTQPTHYYGAADAVTAVAEFSEQALRDSLIATG
jgi:hypothetical protein